MQQDERVTHGKEITTMTAAILLFLKANWKPIAILLFIGLLFARYETVVLERNHYQKQLTADKVVLNDYKDELSKAQTEIAANNQKAEADKKQAADVATELTQKYNGALTKLNQQVDQNEALNAKNIALSKELYGVKLSLNAVRLFNASKQAASDSAGVQQPGTQASPTVSGHGSDTGTTGISSSTLGDMLQVVNRNDSNHKKCIAQVKKWQDFWNDFSTKYNSIGAH
jgi:hypothetical protein